MDRYQDQRNSFKPGRLRPYYFDPNPQYAASSSGQEATVESWGKYKSYQQLACPVEGQSDVIHAAQILMSIHSKEVEAQRSRKRNSAKLKMLNDHNAAHQLVKHSKSISNTPGESGKASISLTERQMVTLGLYSTALTDDESHFNNSVLKQNDSPSSSETSRTMGSSRDASSDEACDSDASGDTTEEEEGKYSIHEPLPNPRNSSSPRPAYPLDLGFKLSEPRDRQLSLRPTLPALRSKHRKMFRPKLTTNTLHSSQGFSIPSGEGSFATRIPRSDHEGLVSERSDYVDRACDVPRSSYTCISQNRFQMTTKDLRPRLSDEGRRSRRSSSSSPETFFGQRAWMANSTSDTTDVSTEGDYSLHDQAPHSYTSVPITRKSTRNGKEY